MAESEVAICNQALSWLGGDKIISLDDDQVEAKLCKANYDLLRDAVLEDREWTFAVARIEPPLLVNAPVYGYSHAFQISPNVIRVLQVTDSKSHNWSKLDWLREGGTIVTDAARIWARVLVRVTDTTKFSPAFDQVLAARIAMDICLPLTNSPKMMERMTALYGEKIRLAASTDGMQGRSYRTRSDSLTVVR